MNLGRTLGWVVTLIVAASIGMGLYIVGSPMNARLAAADRERVNDLSNLEDAIQRFRVEKHRLPKSLDELEELGYASSGLTTDPMTKLPYAYSQAKGDQFELCAEFDTDTTDKVRSDPYMSQAPYQRHEAGRGCFVRPGKD